MKIDLDPAIEARTACQKNFSCASGNMERICKVRELMVGEALLIECADNLLCHYKESFGSWAICTCPVRKEIYDRTGL